MQMLIPYNTPRDAVFRVGGSSDRAKASAGDRPENVGKMEQHTHLLKQIGSYRLWLPIDLTLNASEVITFCSAKNNTTINATHAMLFGSLASPSAPVAVRFLTVDMYCS
jgi:hypothetical protein